MRCFAVLVAAFVCSGALSADTVQSATKDPDRPLATVQSKPEPQIRQSKDSDLAVKELHSPITVDLDASWLRTLPFREDGDIRLPRFYCDDVTLEDMEVKKKLDKKDGGVEVHIGFQLRVRPQKNDKVIELEFALLNGERELQLERIEDIEINAGKDEDESFSFDMSRDNFAEFTAEGAAPQLRVSMIVLND